MRHHLRSLLLFSVLANFLYPCSPTLAQAPTPLLRVEGALESGDAVLSSNNSLYDEYTFEGQAGQVVTIIMESVEFDTYLGLVDPRRQIARNDDYSDTNYNAVITMELPLTGTYTILANAHRPEARGRYSLTVVSANQPTFSNATIRQVEANRLHQQGIEQYRAREFREALRLWEVALHIYREIGDHNGEANALTNLGLANASISRYEEAIALHQQALAVYRAVGDRNMEAGALNNLGLAYRSLGRSEEAIELYQQALPLSRAVDDRIGIANALGNLGVAYLSLSRYEEAIAHFQQALPIFRAVSDRNSEAGTLNNLGVAYSSLSRYQEAIALHQQTLPIYRAVGDRNGEADALMNLGNVYISLSRYEEAITLQQQTLAIYRAVGDRNNEAAALNNLGLAYRSLSRYEEAIAYHQQALLIYQAVSDRSGEATVLMNLGSAYLSLSRYEESVAFYQQALPILRMVGDRNGEANVLGNLGLAYDSLSRYEEAIALSQQALTIYRALGDRNGEAKALNNLGNTYGSLSRYEEAIVFYQQALPIYREVGDRNGEAKALDGLGLAYSSLSRHEEAIALYQQALPIYRAVGDREGEGELLANIGRLLAIKQQPELAIVFYKQSVNVRESIRGNIRGLDRELQQSYTDSIADDYRRLADLLLQADRVLEAQRVLDLLKVQELQDYLRDVRGNAETARGVEFIRQEQDILDRYNLLQQNAIALNQELTQLQTRQRGGRLTATEQSRLTQLTQLQEAIKIDFNNFARSPEIRQLVGQLSVEAREQTISLGALDRLSDNLGRLNAALIYPLVLEDRLEIIITVPNGKPLRRTVSGVGRAQLNRAIADFRQALQDPRKDAIAPAQQLYQWLIKPLEQDLAQANVQTLLYASDGALRYIPLAALHDGRQWLVQRYRINNITAASLEELNTAPVAQPRILAGAFADASIVYEVPVGGQEMAFRGLVFAGQEVNSLAALANTQSFVDRAFTLAAIKERMNGYNILHLATHAAVVPGDASQSFILFGNGDRPTLRDIENWTLNNIDLVVLSACETGLGGFDNNGEQILGLGYQFQNQGARAVIASLWQVSDGGTQVLMDAFYAALANGKTKAEALRLAQVALITGDYSTIGGERAGIAVESTRTGLPVEVRDRLNHPYYWAPFILIGNGL